MSLVQRLHVVFAFALLALLPMSAMAAGDDPAISDFDFVNSNSSVPANTTDKSFSTFYLTPSEGFESGDTLSFVFMEVGSGEQNGFQFVVDETYHLSIGTNSDAIGFFEYGSVQFDGAVYEMTLLDDMTASRTSISFGGINTGDDGCYQLGVTSGEVTEGADVNFTMTDPFAVGEGSCSVAVESAAFGHNLALQWDAVEGATSYEVSYHMSGGEETVIETTGTSYIVHGLDAETTYYAYVAALDEDGEELFDSSAQTLTTEEVDVTEKRAKKLTFPKKHRKKKNVRAKFEMPETFEPYISEVRIQVRTRKGKKAKTFKNIDPDNGKKKIKKKQLKKKYRNKKLKARVRYIYNVGDGSEQIMSRWSKYKNFKFAEDTE